MARSLSYTRVYIRDGESSKVIIYRKPTHTDQYLNFDSNFKPYTEMFWHVTWFTQAQVTNRFPPHALKKDAATASKAYDR